MFAISSFYIYKNLAFDKFIPSRKIIARKSCEKFEASFENSLSALANCFWYFLMQKNWSDFTSTENSKPKDWRRRIQYEHMQELRIVIAYRC